MKNTFILLILLIPAVSSSDFSDATAAYENKEYQPAYEEFFRLAKLGNKRAQFNLGVMYLKGEFVSTNLVQAFAWGKLSEHDERPEFSQLPVTAFKQLDAEKQKLAVSAYQKLLDTYGEDAIYANLSPISYVDKEGNETTKSSHSINHSETIGKAPKYPAQALSKGVQGWATLGFEIHPDGSARNPYVIESFPENYFEKESIDIVQYFKFKISYSEGVTPYHILARQTIVYKLRERGEANSFNKIYQQRLKKLEKLAEDHHPDAQYIYAMTANSDFLDKDQRLPQNKVNKWLLKAAQNGHLDAQYQLGNNILRGKGCKIEKQKGLDWIVYAAEQGHPRASREAYRQLTRSKHLNNTDNKPEYWLKLSAEKGDPDSQLYYADWLISNPDSTAHEFIQARKLLQQNEQHRKKSAHWYKVSADLYERQDNSKKASKHRKKAQKLAKKYGWNEYAAN